MSLSCPINFGDCPDCEHYQAGESYYECEESNKVLEQTKESSGNELGTITEVE